MKVCIYGAGAIGGWLGVHLAQAGHEVSVVARGATLEALQKHGLECVQNQAPQSRLQARVNASAHPKDLGPQDWVIVAVKAPAMAEVAQGIAPLLGPKTIVMTAMNGVPWWFFQGFGGRLQDATLNAIDPAGVIAKAIPAHHVVGCVVHSSCSLDAPGVVRHHFGQGLILGEPAAQRGEVSARVQQLVNELHTAGFNASASSQIQKDIWYKLWGNMTVNPVSAITGATTDLILKDDLVRDFVSKIMLEAKAIGEQIGIPIAQTPEDRHAVTMKLGAFKTSMLQDVEAGKTVELDALVSVVRELGQLTQVDTPYTDTLLGLSRLHANVRGLYPAQSVHD
jgi:2-dehydropantoate 2-reductase